MESLETSSIADELDSEHQSASASLAESIGVSETPESSLEATAEKAEKKLEIITLSDTDNDIEAIHANLRLYNIVDGEGHWNPSVQHVKIVHTGDLVNKRSSDMSSLEYMRYLRLTAPPSCSVELIAGNHEIELLDAMPFVGEDPYVRSDFEDMSVLSYDEPVLFMHGYPTRELLETLLAYGTIQAGITALNTHFKHAVADVIHGDTAQLADFSYKKHNANTSEKNLFRDINPETYYKKHGEEVSLLLEELGVSVVIHGHKPQKQGVQTESEASKYLRGVTMINNDCAVSSTRQSEHKKKSRGPYGSVQVTIHAARDAAPKLTLRYTNKKRTNAADLARPNEPFDLAA